MKKKKMLLNHCCLYSYEVNDFYINIVKHTQMKTGIVMFSLDLNGFPILTCDNYIFLKQILEFCPCVVFDILENVASIRGITISECEVD